MASIDGTAGFGKVFAACIGVAFGLLLAPAAASAGTASAQITVTARVLPHATIRVTPPATFTITEADVQRGYVNVPAPIAVHVRGNMPEGYRLEFQNGGAQVREAVVEGFASGVVVGASGASAARPAPSRGVWEESLQLRVRIALNADARPGTYPWPLQVSMMSF